VVIVPFQSFRNSSHRGIVERHLQCAQSSMQLAESAAPSGNRRLHSSFFFNELWKQKLINNLNYCLQQHYY